MCTSYGCEMHLQLIDNIRNGVLCEVQVSVSKKVIWDCLDWCVGVYMEWLGPKSKLVIGNAETSAGEEDKGHNVMTSRGYTWTLW